MEVHNPNIDLRITTTRITAPQLRVIHTAPVPLIQAPGAGRIIVPIGFAVVYIFGTVAYSDVGGIGWGPYFAGDTAHPIFTGGLIDPSFLTNSFFIYQPSAFASGVNILPGDDNKSIVLDGADNVGGAIATSTLGAGGAGYVANDTGRLTTGNGDATYKVLTVDGGGAVLTYSITAPGTGYTTGNGQATAVGGAQPGVGAGFTINVNTITLPDGTMKIVSYYQIIPVP